MSVRDSKQNIINRSVMLDEILLVKNFVSKDQIKKHYHKMGLLTHPDAGGNEEFFKTINQAYQILTNDAVQEGTTHLGLKKLKKL